MRYTTFGRRTGLRAHLADSLVERTAERGIARGCAKVRASSTTLSPLFGASSRVQLACNLAAPGLSTVTDAASDLVGGPGTRVAEEVP